MLECSWAVSGALFGGTGQHQFRVQEKGYGKVSSSEWLQPGRLLLCPETEEIAAHFGSCVLVCAWLRRLRADLQPSVGKGRRVFTHAAPDVDEMVSIDPS